MIFLRLWDILIMLGATSAALAIPVRLVLGLSGHASLVALHWAISVVFLGDIVINLFRPVSFKGQVISDRRAVAVHYLKGWFFVDLLAAIPFAALFAVPLLQVLRLVKLARVAQFLYYRRRRHIRHSTLFRLSTFVYWLGLTAHWLACGWLSLHPGYDPADAWGSYIKALYWCMTTLTTVGYGDITPQNNTQMVYTMVVMVLGVGVYGYVIGNVANMLANIDLARAHYLANMERLATFLKYRNIPPSMQRLIYDYYAYLWEHRLGYDESAVLSGLPASLQTEVSLLLKREFIEKVPFLKGVGQEVMRDIAFELRPVIFTPGTYIFRAGEIGRHVYFISHGTVEVVSADGTKILASLSDGDFFGEIALLFRQPRSASVRATEYCDMYCLDKDTFDRILVHYPDFGRHIREVGERRRANP